MIRFLLVTHEALGASLARCAEHILGVMPPHLDCVAVMPGEDPVQVEDRARALLQQLVQGGGVLVFTDMVGATPSNVAARLVQPGRIEAIAGVNLPMLMRALTYRDRPLAEVADKALAGGTSGITRVQTC